MLALTVFQSITIFILVLSSDRVCRADKQMPPKKVVAKKSPAKTATEVKKTVAKKPAAAKKSTAKKPAAKKPVAKKAAAKEPEAEEVEEAEEAEDSPIEEPEVEKPAAKKAATKAPKQVCVFWFLLLLTDNLQKMLSCSCFRWFPLIYCGTADVLFLDRRRPQQRSHRRRRPRSERAASVTPFWRDVSVLCDLKIL